MTRIIRLLSSLTSWLRNSRFSEKYFGHTPLRNTRDGDGNGTIRRASNNNVFKYIINIDFDIEKKSLNGFVIIKAQSIRDLNKLQIDLAENLNIKKVTYKNQNLSFSREFDAVLIDFISGFQTFSFEFL